jgi:hypothetical protein
MPIEKIYKIVRTPIHEILLNPSNPRTISDEKFERLVESIKEAPWMLKLRPIVVNKDGVILGGNQRYKACLEAGMEDVWVLWADQITDEQQRRFIIKDNLDYGKWDQEIIQRRYSKDELLKHGVEISLLEQKKPTGDPSVKPPPVFGSDDDAVEPDISEEELEKAKKNFNDNTIKQIVFQLPSDIYEGTLKKLDEISKELYCDDNSEVFLRLINFYEVSNGIQPASSPDSDSIERESGEDQDGQVVEGS